MRIVDEFLMRQQHARFPSGAILLQTFGPVPAGGGGPCGRLCELRPTCEGTRCRFYVYDNAVAAIYLTRRGKLGEARRILDALASLLYQRPRDLQLLARAYGESGEILEWGIDTGNNAWVGMAFTHFAAASGEACYAAIARDILRTIAREASCNDALGGFMGILPRARGTYRSTEHNVDMFAFARMLGEPGLQNQAGRFVGQMYGFDPDNPHTYATGTGGARICDPSPGINGLVAADTQFWNLLADADPSPDRKAESINHAMQAEAQGGLLVEDRDIIGDGATLLGVRFTTAGNGAQWENTASGVMALGYYRSVYHTGGEDSVLLGMRASLLHQLWEYRAVLASVLGGNLDAWLRQDFTAAYPGGSDTGIGWTYMRYPHTAATAWTGLMLLEANPFAPPPGAVPTGQPGWQCAAR